MKDAAIVSFVFGVALAGATGSAHHAIASVYDSNRPARITGTIVRIEFINPHPLLMIKVDAAGGKTDEWTLELDNRSELASIGMTSDTLRPGDEVVAAGSMARTHPNRMYLRRLERPADGFLYEQVGSSPRIRRPSR